MTHGLSRVALTAALLHPWPCRPLPNRSSIASPHSPVAANLPADKDKAFHHLCRDRHGLGRRQHADLFRQPARRIGFIDISDARPRRLPCADDGRRADVGCRGRTQGSDGVNTSESKDKPSGKLAVVDIASKAIDATCDIGGQPDSVAVAKDGSFVAIAIENERDEEVNDGALPQMPAGDLVIVTLKDGVADCGSIKRVALTDLADVAPEDPEPEFVAINSLGEIAVTLQENNHIAIVDGKTGEVKAHFSAGTVDLTGIDTKSDGALKFSGTKEGVPREPMP